MAETSRPQGVLHFPEGLPGFEQLTDFLLLEEEELRPIVFLQSLSEPPVCLPAVPAEQVHPGYSLELAEDDRRVLGLAPEAPPHLLCLVILHLGDGSQPVTANLLAPIVVNLGNWTARQVIQIHSPYSTLAEVS